MRPLSRDHLIALMAAQKLMKAGSGQSDRYESVSYFLFSFEAEISLHLDDEERVLPAYIKDKALENRLVEEHEQLRRFLSIISNQFTTRAINPEILTEAGMFLDKHVRFEEHELFLHIEDSNSASEIKQLLALTDKIEAERRRNNKGDRKC